MITEEQKVDDIIYEDMHYAGEDNNFRITGIDNSVTRKEILQRGIKGNSYNVVSKKAIIYREK